jgi:hypothetical protein
MEREGTLPVLVQPTGLEDDAVTPVAVLGRRSSDFEYRLEQMGSANRSNLCGRTQDRLTNCLFAGILRQPFWATGVGHEADGRV